MILPRAFFASVFTIAVHSPLWHEKGTGAEVRPAVVSGIVTGDVPVSLLGSFRKGVFGRRASTGSDVFSL